MKTKTSIFASFVVGAAIASLPYTLSSGKTFAQGAGPALAGGQSGFPPQGGQGFPGQGGQQGFPGQGGPGQPNQMQQMQMQMAMSTVQSMTSSGNFLFAASGDTIYKINMNSMQLEGQVKLPHPQNQPQNRQGGQGQVRGGANGRPGQGLGGGGGAIPPK